MRCVAVMQAASGPVVWKAMCPKTHPGVVHSINDNASGHVLASNIFQSGTESQKFDARP